MSSLDKIRALVDARAGSPDPKIPTLNLKTGDATAPGGFTSGADFIQRSTVVGTPTKIPKVGEAPEGASSGTGDDGSGSGDSGLGTGSDSRYGDKDKHDLSGRPFKGTFSRNYRGYP
jgi:hypothetical protein